MSLALLEGMSGNLGNILKAAQQAKKPAPEQEGQKQPGATAETTPAQAVGKYRHSDYERLTVYVQKDTKKAATRQWEDEGNRDTSDLVQQLLDKYLSA